MWVICGVFVFKRQRGGGLRFNGSSRCLYWGQPYWSLMPYLLQCVLALSYLWVEAIIQRHGKQLYWSGNINSVIKGERVNNHLQRGCKKLGSSHLVLKWEEEVNVGTRKHLTWRTINILWSQEFHFIQEAIKWNHEVHDMCPRPPRDDRLGIFPAYMRGLAM